MHNVHEYIRTHVYVSRFLIFDKLIQIRVNISKDKSIRKCSDTNIFTCMYICTHIVYKFTYIVMNKSVGYLL